MREQRRAVQQDQRSRRKAGNQLRSFQFGDGAADGLDRQAEVIGDVLMRHWKIEVLCLSQPAGQIEEKRCQTAFRASADQQGMLLRTSKLVCRCIQQKTRNSTVPGSDGKEGATFEIEDHYIGRRFYRQRVLQIGPAKHLAGQIETNNVPCAVLKRSATSDNSLDDQKDVVGRVALTDDHLVAAVTDRSSPKRNYGALDQLLVVAMYGWPVCGCYESPIVEAVTVLTRRGRADAPKLGHLLHHQPTL